MNRLRQVLEELTLRVTHLPDPAEVMALHSLPPDVSWRVFRTGVDIDVGPFVARAFVRAREVDDADALVSVDPEVMGGAQRRGGRGRGRDAGAVVPVGLVALSRQTGNSEVQRFLHRRLVFELDVPGFFRSCLIWTVG